MSDHTCLICGAWIPDGGVHFCFNSIDNAPTQRVTEATVTTAIPTICHGCGGALSSTAFYEDGNGYHFGCRPSQQVVIVGSDSQREHADLLARIAELEGERDDIFYEFTSDMNDSSDEWQQVVNWLKNDYPHLVSRLTDRGTE